MCQDGNWALLKTIPQEYPPVPKKSYKIIVKISFEIMKL